jgi:4-amino-4-deoxy-L-arabinose transferase-like glycosyltransferase
VAWRLPSFLAAMALAILVFRRAASAFGEAAGFLALGAFSLNQLTPRLASLVRTDMPLALVVFVTGVFIWDRVVRERPWTRSDRWRFFVLLTIGLYVKGPILFAFLLPGILLFRWLGPGKSGNAWPGWWPWLGSLGMFALWVVGGILVQPGFFDQVVLHEFLGRFATAEQRPHPPYFYLAHLLQKFAPWSELMLLLLWFRLRSKGVALWDRWRGLSPGVRWLVCWSLGGLILLSLVPSKRIDRIFPVIPPLSLLLAAQVAALSPAEAIRRQAWRWSAFALVLAVPLTGYYALSRVVDGHRYHADALSDFGRLVRQEVRQHGWRCQAVTSHDGGMLLYLEKTQFIQPDRAIAEWNLGNLDALVVEARQAPELLPALRGAVVSPLRSVSHQGMPGQDYVLLVR